MMPLLLIFGAAVAAYFLLPGQGGSGVSSVKSKSQLEAEQKARFIMNNPKSLAALLVTDPVKAQAMLDEGQEYSNRKVAAYHALTDEQKKNYRGGF